MSHQLPSPLPFFDRCLLRTVAKIVPAPEREEWGLTWQAELWHLHHPTRYGHSYSLGSSANLAIGLIRDALWLRTEACRRSLAGTAFLCLASLLGLCLLSTLIGLAINGSWHSLAHSLRISFERSLFAAPLIVFVAFVTASHRNIELGFASKKLDWIKRQFFLSVKTSLILLVTFLLSADICRPIHPSLPNTADLFQILFFVLFALVGLRWAFRDQEQRCKQCLHLLSTPARVGRPSHNLLEWNGTELLCKRGHGLLSIPEMESSWCQSSQWIDQSPSWGQTASM
jgi:hypothetical protein